jgi:FAD/FMN-containing dehydrogenase
LRPRPEHEVLFAVPARETGIAASLALEVLGAALAPSYVEVLNRTATAALELGDEPLLILGCGGSGEEIDVQGRRLQDLAGKQTIRTYAETEGAQVYHRLRDFPGGAFLPHLLGDACPLDTHGAGSEPHRRGQGDSFLGSKLSILPSKLAQVLSDIEAEAGARKINCAILSHVGSGIAYVRCGAADDDAVVQFAQRLRAAARQADGWAVFDLLPARLKASLDTWDAEVPGIALMRGVKNMLDPKGRLSPGRFAGGI